MRRRIRFPIQLFLSLKGGNILGSGKKGICTEFYTAVYTLHRTVLKIIAIGDLLHRNSHRAAAALCAGLCAGKGNGKEGVGRGIERKGESEKRERALCLVTYCHILVESGSPVTCLQLQPLTHHLLRREKPQYLGNASYCDAGNRTPCNAEQEKHYFWYLIFVSSPSTVYLFSFCTESSLSRWMSQDNLTGANILDCTAQYKAFTSVLITEEVTKYLPRETGVPAMVRCNSGETNVHT